MTFSPKLTVTRLANRHLKHSIFDSEVLILTLHPHSQHLLLLAQLLLKTKNKESPLISLFFFTSPVICQSCLFYLQNIPLLHLLPSPLVNTSPSHCYNGLPPSSSISLFCIALRVIFYDVNQVIPFPRLKILFRHHIELRLMSWLLHCLQDPKNSRAMLPLQISPHSF